MIFPNVSGALDNKSIANKLSTDNFSITQSVQEVESNSDQTRQKMKFKKVLNKRGNNEEEEEIKEEN